MSGISGIIDKKDSYYPNLAVEMAEKQGHRGAEISSAELDVCGKRLNIAVNKRNRESTCVYAKDSIILACDRNPEETGLETLAEAYNKSGIEGLLSLLSGAFAVVLADRDKNTVFFLRDRSGQKPLYYTASDKYLMFSSEIKSFYANPDFIPEINEDTVDEFFMYKYVSGKNTLIKDVYAVRPGEYIQIEDDIISGIKYFEFKSDPGIKRLAKAKRRFIKVFSEETQKLMPDEGHAGVMLSGGIDSSLVAVYASEKDRNVIAYSSVFDQTGLSEEKYADMVCSALSVKEEKYNMSAEKFSDIFYDCQWACDSPLSVPNILGIYLLCREAYDTDVCLLGDGSDELFGGYSRFSEFLLVHFLKDHFPFLWKWKRFGRKMDFLADQFSKGKMAGDPELEILLGASDTGKDALFELRPSENIERAMANRKTILNEIPEKDIMRKYMAYEFRTFLPECCNRDDKMFNVWGMEPACPFLSEKVVDFAASLDRRLLVRPCYILKRKHHRTKIVPKEVAKDMFGDKFAYRRKMGWSFPLKEMFAEDGMQELFREKLLPGMYRRNIVDASVVEKWWNDPDSVNSSEYMALWTAVSFEAWAEVFIDGRAERPLTGEQKI